jgi:hypothetical protein
LGNHAREDLGCGGQLRRGHEVTDSDAQLFVAMEFDELPGRRGGNHCDVPCQYIAGLPDLVQVPYRGPGSEPPPVI